MIVILAGVLAGLAGAALLSRSLQALLFGVTGSDPVVYVSVTAVLVVVAAIAAWVPAWRATGIEPVAALREE